MLTHHEQELGFVPHDGRVRNAESRVIVDDRVLEPVAGRASEVVVGSIPHRAFLDSTHKRPASALKGVVAGQS